MLIILLALFGPSLGLSIYLAVSIWAHGANPKPPARPELLPPAEAYIEYWRSLAPEEDELC